jgi:aldose 1-epimerase
MFTPAAFAVSIIGCALAQPGSLRPDAQGRYTLEAKGIKAQFIPYGATLTNLWVNGIPALQDVVMSARLLTCLRQERCTA